MKVGVFNCQIKLDLSIMAKLYGYLLEHVKTRREKVKIRRELKEIEKGPFFPFKEILRKFSSAVYEMLEMEEYPEIIGKFYEWQTEEITEFSWERHIPNLVSPIILSDFNDVLCIEMLSPGEEEALEEEIFELDELDNFFLDVVSVKKEGAILFLKFLKTIPLIGETLVINKDLTETHSSRYTFRPYALAVRLWLKNEASKMIPKDLRDFLNGACRYYTSKEWRTSIVLSAITAESLLADLYEEEYHEPSPSKATLGELFEHAKKKIDFPQNIAEAIQMTNNARISAVHRSRFPVSDREAINALYGATNFTMWYFSRFQTKP